MEDWEKEIEVLRQKRNTFPPALSSPSINYAIAYNFLAAVVAFSLVLFPATEIMKWAAAAFCFMLCLSIIGLLKRTVWGYEQHVATPIYILFFFLTTPEMTQWAFFISVYVVQHCLTATRSDFRKEFPGL